MASATPSRRRSAPNFTIVVAPELGQRGVDRVRTLPTDGSGAPAADVFRVVELEGRERLPAARPECVHVRRAESERLQARRERLGVARILPGAEAVANREDGRVVEHVRAVQHQHVRPPAQRAEPLILVRHEQLVGLHDRAAGLVRLVVDVEAAQRRLVVELVLRLERPHQRLVDDKRRAVRVGIAVLVLLHRAVDRFGRPRLQDVEAGLADRRMGERNDRVGEQSARRNRAGAGGRTSRAGDAAAAVGVEEHHRHAAIEGVREVPVALVRRRPDLLLAARRPRPVAFGGGPEERPVLDDGPADPAAVQPVVRVRQPRLFLGHAGDRVEEVFRLAPDRPRLIEAAAVIVVGARSRGHVEHAAAGPAHLGVVGVDLDLDLLDRLDRRIEHGAAAQFRDRHAVEQVVVGADAAAAERDARRVGLILLPVELRIPDRHHGGDRDADQEGVAARRR